MPGRMEFSFGFSSHDKLAGRTGGGVIRVLLMGNFSGRDHPDSISQTQELMNRPMPFIDVDNFDTVMSRIAPLLPISDDLVLEFRELEDFHPDHLYGKLPLFQALKETRDGLADDARYQQTLSQLKSADGVEEKQVPSKEPPAEAETDLFKRLLGSEAKSDTARKAPAGDSIHQLIRRIVAPHVVPDINDERQTYIRSLDDAIGSQMRDLLHDPRFQALESIWRSAYRLVTGLETDETLKIHILDISKTELMADLASAGDDLKDTALYKKLVEQQVLTPGGEPWSVIAGDYSFSQESADLNLLAALGAIASQAGGPFLAQASARFLGCDDYQQIASLENWQPKEKESAIQWQALRNSPVAPWVGLLLPRILLRLPYGDGREEIDGFAFEEMPGAPGRHEDLLWGSPAFACAQLMAAELQQNGISATPGGLLDIEDLPGLIYEEQGEKRLMPCAESRISERTGEAILARGLMPLMSYANRNAVRLMRLQSIAEPPQALRGVWI